MRRGQSIALLVLFALTAYDFSVRPQRLVESFKALRCCTQHCQKSGNMSEAERCCGVVQDQAGLRAVHAGSPDVGAAAAIVLPGRLELPAPILIEVSWTQTAEPSRAPPIFLANQSLLI